jgi:hypothetical protein
MSDMGRPNRQRRRALTTEITEAVIRLLVKPEVAERYQDRSVHLNSEEIGTRGKAMRYRFGNLVFAGIARSCLVAGPLGKSAEPFKLTFPAFQDNARARSRTPAKTSRTRTASARTWWDATGSDGARFAGYAPVLEAVATVLAEVTNPTGLSEACRRPCRGSSFSNLQTRSWPAKQPSSERNFRLGFRRLPRHTGRATG